jgi:hypothetical protein
MNWRSDDPAQDEVTLKRLAKLAVDFADVNGLGPDVLYGEGPDDPSGLVPLLREVFFLGRACGARAVAHVVDGTPIPDHTPRAPYDVSLEPIGRRLVH